MGTTIVSLIPLIIGSAVVPVQIIIDILLLKSPKQGLLKASPYVGGMTTLRLLQGLIFGLLLTNSAPADAEVSGGKSPVVSTLLLVLGIFLLITAYKQWRKDDDSGSNGTAVGLVLTSGAWITGTVASGHISAAVGDVYVTYVPV